MKDFTVQKKDLNAIDYLNGDASVSAKQKPVINYFAKNANEFLKGALAKTNGGAFSLKDEWMFIISERDKILHYLLERYEYKNLPSGLNKYRIEWKNVENGSVAIIKGGLEFHALHYVTLEWDIYTNPTKIKIIEPKSSLNGNIYSEKQFTIIRNNINAKSSFLMLWRWLRNMERALFQIEKNLTSSAPKGLINLKNAEFEEPHEDSVKNSMEKIINGQDTFYTIRVKDIEKYNPMEDSKQDIFIPIELTDRTQNLIINYKFFESKVREYIGAMTDDNNDKKERLITSEMDAKQPISNTARQHGFNIRKVDIEKLNKLFNLNVTIEYLSDSRENAEEENGEENVSTE